MLWPLGATSPLRLGVDLMALPSLFSHTTRVRAEASLGLSDEFGLRIPCNFDIEMVRNGPFYMEGAICLDYHPMGWPLCISLSLAQVGILANHPWEEKASFYFLNEMAIAWDWQTRWGLYFRPQIVIRDPNRMFEMEYKELSELFSRFAMVRFSCLVGWSFYIGPSIGDEDM